MITASKNIVPDIATNDIQIAKDSLKKVSSSSDNTTDATKEHTLALIAVNDHLDNTVNHIEKNGFTIIDFKRIQLSLDEAKEFYKDHQTQNYYDKMIHFLSCENGIFAMILEKEDAIKDWKYVMGPANYKKARKTNPNSIRALFGKDASQNATYGSDSEANAKKEIESIFGLTPQDIPTDVVAQEAEHHTTISQQEAVVAKETASAANSQSDDIKEQVLYSNSSDATNNVTEAQQDPENGEDIVAPSTLSDNNSDKDVAQTQPLIVRDIAEEETVSNNTPILDNATTNGDDADIKNRFLEDTILSSTKVITHQQDAVVQIETAILDELLQNNVVVTFKTPVQLETTTPEIAENDVTVLKEAIIVSCPPGVGGDDPKIVHTATEEDDSFDEEIQDKQDVQVEIDPLVIAQQENISSSTTVESENAVIEYTQQEDIISLSSTTVVESVITEKTEYITAIASIIPTEQEPAKNDSFTPLKKITKNVKPAEEEKKTAVNKKVLATTTKKETVSIKSASPGSRIRQPSIKKTIESTILKSVTGSYSIGKTTSQTITNGRKSQTITTNGRSSAIRIARLSPSATINTSTASKAITPVATAVKKNATVAPTTKVLSKPRIVASSKTLPPPKKEEEKKVKKTSFISRLTTPTVSSANKKADNETVITNNGVSHRAAVLSKKGSLNVSPSMSNFSPKVPPARTNHKEDSAAAAAAPKKKQQIIKDQVEVIVNGK